MTKREWKIKRIVKQINGSTGEARKHFTELLRKYYRYSSPSEHAMRMWSTIGSRN